MPVDVTIVGCAGSFPGPDSPASSYLVRAEHEGRTWSLVFDLGNGALGALQRHISPYDVDAILISHLHPDHFIDLCGLYVMMRYAPDGLARDALPTWGPTGTGRQLARAYGNTAVEDVYEVFEFNELVDDAKIEIGPFRITTYPMRHPIPSFGFRIEAAGRTLAYTGDTDLCDALTPLLTGADLVLIDSAFVEGRDSPEGIHLTGRRAAEAAVRAGGVRCLMLTHIPPWNDPEVARAEAQEVWPGTVELAQPGATYPV